MSAQALVSDVRSRLAGEPVFLAGSLVAAEAHRLPDAWSDVDIFCPTDQVLISTTRHLIDQGFTMDDRFARVWQRWLKYGFKKWHTNSIRLTDPNGFEYNLVYKLADGHPTTSLSQVLESFDFGLLGMGYDMQENIFRDMRSYLFPGYRLGDPLPMMPNKRDAWEHGFISQYNGLREFGRYAKYHSYGHDMTAVKQALMTGYNAAAMYHFDSFDEEKRTLAEIYFNIALKIDADAIDELAEAAAKIDYKDALDVIMEAVE